MCSSMRVLTWLVYRLFSALYPRESFIRVLFVGALFAFTYGVLDEVHQLFIFGRGSRLTDVAIDGLGIALASLLLFAKQRIHV